MENERLPIVESEASLYQLKQDLIRELLDRDIVDEDVQKEIFKRIDDINTILIETGHQTSEPEEYEIIERLEQSLTDEEKEQTKSRIPFKDSLIMSLSEEQIRAIASHASGRKNTEYIKRILDLRSGRIKPED